jgi:hypothetical protein
MRERNLFRNPIMDLIKMEELILKRLNNNEYTTELTFYDLMFIYPKSPWYKFWRLDRGWFITVAIWRNSIEYRYWDKYNYVPVVIQPSTPLYDKVVEIYEKG